MSTERARGYRLAETRIGDTIQDIAGRELGDVARWPELVSYNNLAPPYLVDELADMEGAEDGRVLLTGTRIRIPSVATANPVADPSDIFGTDMALEDGQLDAGPDGDFLLVRDVPNLVQALENRLATHEGELLWHPDYGNPTHDLIGDKASPIIQALAAKFGERTIRSDKRISRVEAVTAATLGDAITIEATAIAIDGRSLPVGST